MHYQRFGEALRIATDHLDSKNFYAFNPAFDKKPILTVDVVADPAERQMVVVPDKSRNVLGRCEFVKKAKEQRSFY